MIYHNLVKLYIPVWIDLKDITIFAIVSTVRALHSSMDRFKALDFEFSIDNSLTLHSSMDRFKVWQKFCRVPSLSHFTFQYG